MLRRVVVALVLVAVGAGAAAIVFSAFIVPHEATGTVNTAVSGTESLYICQPSGTTVSPQCPIDTNGADEVIFAANEDLLAGSVEWQKIRVTNVGTEPWDILSMTPSWTETQDPSGLCETVPEGVAHMAGNIIPLSPTGPTVTILGETPAAVGMWPEPVQGMNYNNVGNNNHNSIAGSATFYRIDGGGSGQQTVHVVPGGYDDLLLGIRLPTGTPDACLNVVWALTTTWEVQTHIQ